VTPTPGVLDSAAHVLAPVEDVLEVHRIAGPVFASFEPVLAPVEDVLQIHRIVAPVFAGVEPVLVTIAHVFGANLRVFQPVIHVFQPIQACGCDRKCASTRLAQSAGRSYKARSSS